LSRFLNLQTSLREKACKKTESYQDDTVATKAAYAAAAAAANIVTWSGYDK